MKSDRRYWLLGLRIAGEFGASIAAPVIILSIIGRYLDRKFGTSPYFLVGSFALAFVVSAVFIYKRAKYFDKLYKEIEKKDQTENK